MSEPLLVELDGPVLKLTLNRPDKLNSFNEAHAPGPAGGGGPRRARAGDADGAADRRRKGLLRRAGSRRPQRRRGPGARPRRYHRDVLQPTDPAPAGAGEAGRLRGQRRGGGGRREPGAGLRHRPGGALSALHPGLLPHRSGAGYRRDVLPAAPGRRGAGKGSGTHGRAGQRRPGHGVGDGLAGGGRRAAPGGGAQPGATAGQRPDPWPWAHQAGAQLPLSINDLDQQLDLERDLQREAGRTLDYREGVAAFMAKRPAAFRGERWSPA